MFICDRLKNLRKLDEQIFEILIKIHRNLEILRLTFTSQIILYLMFFAQFYILITLMKIKLI